MRSREAWNLLQQMGPGWVANRAAYAVKRQSGWLEWRFRAGTWDRYALAAIAPGFDPERLGNELATASSFFINSSMRPTKRERLAELIGPTALQELVERASRAASGVHEFPRDRVVNAGAAPEWHRHPETGELWPTDHWSRLSELGDSDVKLLWELGRFGVAYQLVRAYWLFEGPSFLAQPIGRNQSLCVPPRPPRLIVHSTAEDAEVRREPCQESKKSRLCIAETFWQLVESFRRDNPPNCGVHWMCGQECAIRVMAWCFGLFGLLDAPASTPQRVAMLVEMLAAHGERIEGNLSFALSQKNNHSVNEALALWTLGVLFPMLNQAQRWEEKGRTLLEQEARRQIYNDGSYVQHSLNYHRLMLQSYAWALALGERCGPPFSDGLYERHWMAARLLYQLTDEQSGCTPNYGSNDGSLLFHLDSCDFGDYRPALALAFWVAERRRVFPPGPWDEPLLWLCGEQPLTKSVDPPERVQLAAKDGGYYTIRGDQTWAFTRCCTYRDRPAQADMLHLDVWWRGVNIVADPGTYSYNSAPPWNNGLASTGVHNSVQVDGLDQMERGPRFTWFYWTRGQVVRRDSFEEGRIKLFEGEHYGYRRRLGVVHRRTVLLVDDRLWVIVDDLYGKGEHELSSQWLFPGAEVEEHSDQMVILGGPAGRFTMSLFSFAAASPAASLRLELVKGEPNTTRGWWSPKYFYKEAALAVVIKQKCALPARWVTLLALGDGAVPCVITETSLSASVGTGQFEMVTAPVLGESVGSVVKEVRFGPERRGRTLP